MGREALGAGKASLKTMINFLFSYAVPIGLFFAGVFSSGSWGGYNLMATLITKVDNTLATSQNVKLATAGVFGSLMAVLGGAFYTIGKEDGLIYKAIGRGAAGYFFGVAVGYLLNVFNGSPSMGNGLFDGLRDIMGG